MRIEHEVQIDAPSARVWEVLRDVESWPQWTPTMDRVELLDSEALALGARVRVKQPRIPAVVWEVTRFEHGAGFDWRAPAFGSATVGGHWITAAGETTTTVVLSIETQGRLALLNDLLTGWLARRWVPREAAGLKARCEASPG